ncbi:MAG: DNA integrity scanning diadenylate cyclase DisA [Candidatus Pacearchaeota archaeon]|jgi:diadenylate cyclase
MDEKHQEMEKIVVTGSEPIVQKQSIVEEKKEIDLLDVLKMMSPGTTLRTALDDILRARLGALIVVDKEGLLTIVEGGFRVNCRFSAQRLVELAKMDGAIVLSNDLKKIVYANTLLTPSAKILTKETGTRHKAAERTAKQFGTIVIAVSERKNKITLYYKEDVYFLEKTSEILRRAAENLQILEKQKEIYNDLISHLNVLEITNLTTTRDVCSVLQTMENIRRISENVKRYLIELGKEGIIVSMRLKELTKNLGKERELLLKDYFNQKYGKADELMRNVNYDFLLETSNIARILFGEIHDKPVSPKGLRILSKTELLEKDIKTLLNSFGGLDKVFDVDQESLSTVFKNEKLIGSVMHDLKNLKEKILVGKSL